MRGDSALAVIDDTEEFKYFDNLDPQLILDGYDYIGACFSNSGRVPPTPYQFRFVEHYIKHQNAKAAYKYAGYRDMSHLTKCGQRAKLHRITTSYTIQTMLKILTDNWMRANEMNADKLATMTLQAYNNADNMKDQLMALRFLANLGGVYRRS